jgi:hypothetical protein
MKLFICQLPYKRKSVEYYLNHSTLIEFGNRSSDFYKYKYILEFCLDMKPHQTFSFVVGS